MSKAKWMMKQYWRVGTIRALLGVAMGMLVLGRYYYSFIPPLSTLGVFGALILASIFFLIFLFAGFLYDESGRLWNERIQVETEKNPYTYVPNFRFFMMEYPFVYSLLDLYKQIVDKFEIDSSSVQDFAKYLESYFALSAGRISDIRNSTLQGTEYMKRYPFAGEAESHIVKPSIGARIKTRFQLEIWKLTWVQNFTGLGQDVLVFAALYIGILIPEAVVENGVTFEYLILGILTISLPLYILLIIAGWFYDKRLKLWSPDIVVKTERTPYSYVPDPNMKAKIYPFLYGITSFFIDFLASLGTSNPDLLELTRYLQYYGNLSADRDQDMEEARRMRREFGQLFTSWNNNDTMEDF